MGRRSGQTLIELIVSLVIFGSVMSTFVAAIHSMKTTQETAETESVLVSRGLRALSALRLDLERTGFESGFPQVHDPADIAEDFPEFEHAHPLDADGQPIGACDLVFRMPSDLDQDGWPDVQNDGTVDWDSAAHAFLLIAGDGGTNRLVRVDADGTRRTIVRNVEQLTFETPSDTGFEIPLDSLRLTLVLVRRGPHGLDYRETFAAVVQLRNGGLEL